MGVAMGVMGSLAGALLAGSTDAPLTRGYSRHKGSAGDFRV